MAMLKPNLQSWTKPTLVLILMLCELWLTVLISLKTADNAVIVYHSLSTSARFIVPDVVHVLYEGRIVKTAGKELAFELEEKGYNWIKEELGE
jgi:Fe-S cluster assembly ATP-binding protein